MMRSLGADEVGVEVTNEHEAKVILNVNAFFIQSRMRC